MTNSEIIYVTPEVYNVRVKYETIIKGLKAEKARSLSTFDKYKKMIEEEAERPSSRFMPWVNYITPFMDKVIDQQVINKLLLENYNEYIKEILKYNQRGLVYKEEVEQHKSNFCRLLDRFLVLEEKYVDLDKNSSDQNNKNQLRIIKMYSLVPEKYKKNQKNICTYCGSTIDEKTKSTKKGVCLECSKIESDVIKRVLQTTNMDFEVEENDKNKS